MKGKGKERTEGTRKSSRIADAGKRKTYADDDDNNDEDGGDEGATQKKKNKKSKS